METDDAELLKRHLADPGSGAFASLVARHIDRVYGVALRQVGGDVHLAQDVAQSVFVDLARKASRLTDRPTLGGWLYRSTQFAASAVVRGERRRRAREQEAYAMQEDTGAKPSVPEVEWTHVGPALDPVLAALSDRDRDAVAMRFFEGRAFSEIGRRLGLSEDAARMRIDRALEKMRTLLARRGITCTAAVLGGVLAAPGLVAAPSGLATNITSSALAAAAGTGAAVGTGATLVSLMSSTKLVTALTVAALLLAAGTAVHDRDEFNQSIVRATDAEKKASDERAAELRTVEDAIATTRAEIAALRARASRPQTPVAATSSAPTAQATQDPDALGADLLARHPEVRQALAEWVDAQTRFSYGGLFRELGLTPEQIATFLELHRGRNMLGGPWGPNSAYVRLRGASSVPPEEFRLRLDALLGPDGRRRYNEYNQSSAARRTANQAASYLAFSDEPLTTDQADELTRILQEAHIAKYPGADTAYDWVQVARNAAAILTPGQQSVLGAMQAADRYQSALNRSAPPVRRP